MKSIPLFWRFFTAFGVLIVLALAILGLIGGTWMEKAALEAVEQRLRAQAAILEDLARAQDADALQNRLRALHNELGSRITLIAGDGRVVLDTDYDDLAGLDNHNHRPEILSARISPFGTSTRYSTTTLQNMTYVARRVGRPDSPVAFVRVAIPVSMIDRDVRGARSAIWFTAAIIGACALFLTWRLVRRITDPLDELTRTALAVANGHYGEQLHLEPRDELGRLARAVNQMSVTLDKQFADVLQKRQQLRALLEGMVDGVIAVDAKYDVSFANEPAGKLLGFIAAETGRRKLWDVVRHHQVLDLADRVLSGAILGRESLETVSLANRTIGVSAAPMIPGDPVRGAVLVFHDLTQLRTLQKTRQDFLANVSHELRTPIAVIAASVETLQNGAIDDPENRDKFLEHIAVHARRLSTVIVDLLAVARLDSGTSTAVLPAESRNPPRTTI